jgi:transcriptional antiterminator RfaH
MSDAILPNNASWYLVHTKPKQEFRALEQLQIQHYTCFLPTLRLEKIRHGKLEAFQEPLFARYLFIHLSSVTSNWSPIRSTRGVSQIVAFGGRFAIMPDACIEALRNGSQEMPRRLFLPGERVAITSGPFAGLEGVFQLTDGEARAFDRIDESASETEVCIGNAAQGCVARTTSTLRLLIRSP